MEQKFIAVAFIGTALLLTGCVPKSADKNTINTTNQSANNPQAAAPTNNQYTAEQVAQHNSRQNCWTSINGSVYNLTDWIGKHPGGQAAILSLCGTDGTAAFTNQHDGQSRPEQTLAQYKVGQLQ